MTPLKTATAIEIAGFVAATVFCLFAYDRAPEWFALILPALIAMGIWLIGLWMASLLRLIYSIAQSVAPPDPEGDE